MLDEVNDALMALRLDVFAKVPRKDAEAAIRVFKAIEAAAAGSERSGVTSADSGALQTRPMNLVRATFSYWYFSTRCSLAAGGMRSI